MTPFGEKLRALRAARRISAKQLASDLHISSAYLSALEHGKRGRPAANFVRQIADYFLLGWEEAEELEQLARRSHPRVVVDTSGLSAKHTELANALAEKIRGLDDKQIDALLVRLAAK